MKGGWREVRAGGNDGKDNRQITEIVRGHKNEEKSQVAGRKSRVASRRFGLCGDTLIETRLLARCLAYFECTCDVRGTHCIV